jgi:hypothetical protein
VCIERDLEVLCLLEVQVSTLGGFLETLLEPWRSFEDPWRSFEELWRSFEVLEAISSLEVHKCWIGALWRYFEALDVQSSIVSLDLSWLSAFRVCKEST